MADRDFEVGPDSKFYASDVDIAAFDAEVEFLLHPSYKWIDLEARRANDYFAGTDATVVIAPPPVELTPEIAETLAGDHRRQDRYGPRYIPADLLKNGEDSRWVAYREYEVEDLEAMNAKQVDDGIAFGTLAEVGDEFSFDITIDPKIDTYGQCKEAVSRLQEKRPDLLSPVSAETGFSNNNPRLMRESELVYMLETTDFSTYWRYLCTKDSSSHVQLLYFDAFGEVHRTVPENSRRSEGIVIPVVEDLKPGKLSFPLDRLLPSRSGIDSYRDAA